MTINPNKYQDNNRFYLRTNMINKFNIGRINTRKPYKLCIKIHKKFKTLFSNKKNQHKIYKLIKTGSQY